MSGIKRWQVLVFLCLLLPLLACNCVTEIIDQINLQSEIVQEGVDPDDLLCLEVFTMFGYSVSDAAELCTMPNECVWGVNTGYDIPTPEQVRAACEAAGVPTQRTPEPSNVAPPGPSNVLPPPPRLDCSAFRLTSPLDGLPNGVATFYWDPLPGATSYAVSVSGEGGGATFGASGDSTSTAGDVSQGAIGGGFSFTVTASAMVDGRAVCSQSVTLYRESSGGAPGSADDGGDSSSDGESPEYGPCGIRGCISIPTPVPPVILY